MYGQRQRCLPKPKMFSENVRGKRLRKAMNAIDRIRGVQNSALLEKLDIVTSCLNTTTAARIVNP